MKKVLVSLITIICVIVGIGVVSAQAEVYTGSCGDDITYTLDTYTGILTISGTGKMPDWSGWRSAPWLDSSANIKKVIVKDGVKSIGYGAFYGCNNLKNVEICGSVEEIETYAFGYCKKLTNITIPNGVTSIGEDAFVSCSSLTNVTIPDSVKTIGTAAFMDCSSLISAVIGNGVEGIERSTFGYCNNLQTVQIGNSVTNIGPCAFNECSNLKSIVIPDSVTNIEEWAFNACNNLTDVYYSCCKECWNNIVINAENNDSLSTATMHYAIENQKVYKFIDENGDVLKKLHVVYGAKIEPPQNPTKPSTTQYS